MKYYLKLAAITLAMVLGVLSYSATTLYLTHEIGQTVGVFYMATVGTLVALYLLK